MRPRLVSLVAVLALAGAQGARELAVSDAAETGESDPPYAPSPGTAPMLSLGYREVASDLLFFRLVGHFGGKHTADSIAALVEAIAALDPHYRKIYLWGSRAIIHGLNRGVGQDHYVRAIRLLERGIEEFPDDYKLYELAGEIYVLDLKTTDPAQQRRWDEKGARLLDTAIHKPNAPSELATFVATLRTRLGQHQRAIDGLEEMLQLTDDDTVRGQIVAKLAELKHTDSAELASERRSMRKQFVDAWQRDRPFISPDLYVLIGPSPEPGFDLADLATGGRDLVEAARPPDDDPPP